MLPILFRIPAGYVTTGFYVAEALLGVIFLFLSIGQKRLSWTPLVMAVMVEVIRRFLVAPSLGTDVPVYSYGVMLVTGFFACLQLAKFLARRSGIDPELFVNAGLIALVTGVIGSRLSHVLENLAQYTDPHRTAWENFKDAANIRSGGLTFYGGLILATFCTIGYGVYKRIPIRKGMDIVAPCVMIGLAFGRVGCLLNGCCYGAECSTEAVPWAIHYPYGSNAYIEEVRKGEIKPDPRLIVHGDDGRPVLYTDGTPVLLQPAVVDANPALKKIAPGEHSDWLHPAQVYSTITAFMIAALLVAYYTLPHAWGRGFALMLLIESPARFLLEMLRAEPAVIGRGSDPPHLTMLPPMSFSMVMSAILFVLGVALWIWFGRGWRRPGRSDEVPAGATPAGA